MKKSHKREKVSPKCCHKRNQNKTKRQNETKIIVTKCKGKKPSQTETKRNKTKKKKETKKQTKAERNETKEGTEIEPQWSLRSGSGTHLPTLCGKRGSECNSRIVSAVEAQKKGSMQEGSECYSRIEIGAVRWRRWILSGGRMYIDKKQGRAGGWVHGRVSMCVCVRVCHCATMPHSQEKQQLATKVHGVCVFWGGMWKSIWQIGNLSCVRTRMQVYESLSEEYWSWYVSSSGVFYREVQSKIRCSGVGAACHLLWFQPLVLCRFMRYVLCTIVVSNALNTKRLEHS